MRHFFYSIATFLIALFFILIGIGCLTIPWSGEVRYFLVRLLLEHNILISVFGFALILVGTGMASYLFLNMRRRPIVIRCGNHMTTIESDLINQYLSHYWKEMFPGTEISSLLTRKHGMLAIDVDLPQIPLEKQKELLTKIEQDLRHLFTTKIGYDSDFYITASFAQPT